MRYGIIYKITNNITGKCYIGQTIKDIKRRWYLHARGDSYCRYLKHAINKYGKDNFTVEEIASATSKSNLDWLEVFFIKEYSSLVPNGYNLREGGAHGKFNDESKKLCSIAQKENWEKEGRKDYYRDMMIKRMADPVFKQNQMRGWTKDIKARRVKVVSVSMSNGEIARFDSMRSTGFSKDLYVTIEKGSYYQNKYWFKDTGQSDEELRTKVLSKLGGRWQPENISPIIAKNLDTGETRQFNNIYEVRDLGIDTGWARKVISGKLRSARNWTFRLVNS